MTKPKSFGPVQGANYVHKQAEYQYFPEEYFSGADVTINFGDLFVDDIISLSFNLHEKLLPVYGYNSHTADRIARGQRIVQGQFSIAFKEAGYLHAIFRHLGFLKHEAKPALAYDIGKEKKPAWLAGMKETMDDFILRSGNHLAYTAYESRVWSQREKFDPSYKDVPHFYRTEGEEWLRHEGFDIFISYGVTPDTAVEKLTDQIGHPYTVRALRGVQIESLGQVVGPTGEAIAETYSFIARDID